MTVDTTKYHSLFYEKNQSHQPQAKKILPYLLEYKPQIRSAIDFGCGSGGWLSALVELIQETTGEDIYITGLDGNWVDRNKLIIPKECFIPTDLNKPVNLDRKYDLALSIEVAEHLCEQSAEIFIQSLTGAADVVLFSAAIPGQGGANHINVQWQNYWCSIFSKYGFIPSDCIRDKIWLIDDIGYWYKQNIIVYVKADSEDKDRFPVHSYVNKPESLNLSHPILYEKILHRYNHLKENQSIIAAIAGHFRRMKTWCKKSKKNAPTT